MDQNTQIQFATEDLPLWMRRARESVDWGILFVLAISALAGWGFVLQPGLPHTNNSENYVYMAHNYAEALTEGRFYPRWNTYANFGYGSPTPHYTPPLAPYSSAIIQLFFTGNSIIAVRIAFFLSMCLAGSMTYTFVLRESGARAAIIASTAYVFSPYIGHIAPYIEGDLATVMAMALFPTFLWSINRLLKLNGPADFAFSVLIISAIILVGVQYLAGTMALLFTIIFYHVTQYRTTFKHIFLSVIGTTFISVMLTSFYWLPALLEHDLIVWKSPIIQAQPINLAITDLIMPLGRVDLNELLPTPQYTLGISIVLLVSASIIIMLRQWYQSKHIQHRLELLFLFTGIILIFLIVEYENNLSWLLGLTSLCLSIAGAGMVSVREMISPDIRRVFTPAIVTILIGAALPVWLIPHWQDNFGGTGAEAQIQHELDGFGIATVPSNQSIPTPRIADLALNTALYNGYLTDTINRISQEQMAIGRTINVLGTSTHQDRFQICVNQTTAFRVMRTFFDGWTVSLNDAPATALNPNAERATNRSCQGPVTGENLTQAFLERDIDTGLMSLTIPGNADSRLMTITLSDTPPRQASWIITWSACIVLITITLSRLRRREPLPYDSFQMVDKLEARLLLVIVFSLALSIILFASPITDNSLHAQPGHKLDDTVAATSHRTSEGINLISYRLDSIASAGDEIEIYLAWRTSERLNENFRVQIHLRDITQNLRWTETDFRHPGGLPTRRWVTGFFISDRHTLQVPESIVPGEYEIAVELYVCEPQCLQSRRVTFFQTNQEANQQFILPTRIQIR